MKGHLVNKQKSQSGSVHAVIAIFLVLALMCSLAYVVYQNYSNRNNSSKTDSVTKTEKEDDNTNKSTYKTYTDIVYNVSFQYPADWTLGDLQSDTYDTHYNRSIDVKDENSEVVATLMTGISGLGGTCGPGSSVAWNFLEVTPTSLGSEKPVVMSFELAPTVTGGYLAYYGLQSAYPTIGSHDICLFYDVFSSNINISNGTNLISFANGVTTGRGKYFATVGDAQKYIQSDKYKAIKKMILSLTY